MTVVATVRLISMTSNNMLHCFLCTPHVKIGHFNPVWEWWTPLQTMKTINIL